ncbi:hypothetical protein ANANG_G00107310 [Anguilla anguilla]|uniref:Uncharacterized protein n=1 Tax=Anguilla anguilla TaxID=7936 RepID=A0A9D3MJP0_ANGAN|nr:hypothetical protein ANANG_G00107310 [Anguilla anguilla]
MCTVRRQGSITDRCYRILQALPDVLWLTAMSLRRQRYPGKPCVTEELHSLGVKEREGYCCLL